MRQAVDGNILPNKVIAARFGAPKRPVWTIWPWRMGRHRYPDMERAIPTPIILVHKALFVLTVS